MSAERWAAVPGYEDSYEVSDLGNVRSLDRWRRNGCRSMHLKKGQPITQHPLHHGHLGVYLYRVGERPAKRLMVHRLVLMAFVGPCPEGHECCHRDGDPANNRIDNLYWGTKSQNMRDSIRHGTHISLLRARRTHCRRNHEYTPENTYYYPAKNTRCCRKCVQDRRARKALAT